MKTFTKLLLFAAIMMATTATCKAQAFTIGELVDLTLKDQKKVDSYLSNKGYKSQTRETSGMSDNNIYTGESDMNISIITPSFETDQKMLVWEFSGSESLYNKLKQELHADGYKQTHTERRSSGLYSSDDYTRPGVTVTCSKDKTEEAKGIYRIAVRYSNAAWYKLN